MSWLWGGLLALTLTFSSGANCATLYILDFDGSINNDHGLNPAWKTPWILYRVSSLRSLLQANPLQLNLPETIELSYGEYVKFRSQLAKGDAILGDLRTFDLDSDPIWDDRPKQFIPGYYYVDENHSFKYYRPGLRNKNYPLLDFQNSLKRMELDPTSEGWQGPAFPLLERGLSRPETVGDVVILTARFHLDREFMQMLEAFKREGFIKYTSSRSARGNKITPKFVFLKSPEALIFGGRGNVARRKANATFEEARQFLESNDGREHMELVPSLIGAQRGEKRLGHTVIVSEDSAENLEAIRKVLESLSAELYFQSRMKFVLFNTSKDADFKTSRWPYRWTVFDGGFGRPALPEEIQSWTKSGDCEEQLGKGKKS